MKTAACIISHTPSAMREATTAKRRAGRRASSVAVNCRGLKLSSKSDWCHRWANVCSRPLNDADKEEAEEKEEEEEEEEEEVPSLPKVLLLRDSFADPSIPPSNPPIPPLLPLLLPLPLS